MKLLTIFFAVILSTSVFANCVEGLESFKKNMHPLLVQRCANCHGDDGVVIGHSQSDASKAYNISKKFANFSNLYASTFVRKVKGEHWLDMDPDEEGMSVAEMEGALKAWWEGGEKVCPPALTVVSKPLQIPVNLPERISGQYVSVSWDLTTSGRGLAGCTFKVEIQRFTSESGAVPGAFRLRRPSVSCAAGTMKIQRVRFMLNDVANSFENIFEDVSTTVVHDGTDKILSDELMIVIDQMGEKKDLTVGFSVMENAK